MRRFRVGDRVTIRDETTLFHTRAQRFVRGHTGTVVEDRPEWVIPEDEAWFRDEDGRKEPFYVVRFKQIELWPSYAGSERDTLETEFSERWLEPAGKESE
jgi:thiocyanate hydrolase subunit alpha